MQVFIENGGDTNIDQKTLREVEEFKKLDLKYENGKAFGFIPKKVVFQLSKSCTVEQRAGGINWIEHEIVKSKDAVARVLGLASEFLTFTFFLFDKDEDSHVKLSSLRILSKIYESVES